MFGIQAQGIGGTDSPLESVEAMAEQYVEAIRTIQPEGPYRVAGSSFGGVVAFAMARALVARGERVGLLALTDSPAPGALPRGFKSDAEILAYLLAKGGSDREHLERLRDLPTDDQLRYFVQYGGAAERLSPDATIEGVRHFLALFRANFEALIRYEPPAYAGPVIFFRATELDGVNPAAMDRARIGRVGALEIVPVGGNHTTMNLLPHVARVIEHLSPLLAYPSGGDL